MKGETLLAMAEFEQELVNNCGEECHQRCLRLFFTFLGGMRLTIPDLDELVRRNRNRQIRAEFRGHNHEELAYKYQLKVRQVRNIVNRG